MHRFFAPALDPGDESVSLPRDEAEHLTRVLRLSTGDTVSVFDGRGHEFLARVASAAPREVRVHLLSRVDAAPEPSVPITLSNTRALRITVSPLAGVNRRVAKSLTMPASASSCAWVSASPLRSQPSSIATR